ncbi:hypothetical protein V5O48_018427 [Marasmius crinis-equi]|uniref:F-box domain-containing protein n=1 Tax=Marasmius crinis-equi TaxID=585013 RepID=A0ABR3EL91_9AGAR
MFSSRITRFLPSISNRKASSSLSSLSPELLNEVFLHFVQETGPPLGYYTPAPQTPSARLFGPWILRGVCPVWKNIVDSNSALWAYIVIRDPECKSVSDCLRVMTTRSANRALLVHALIVTKTFALQLAEHRARWREVHFVIDEEVDYSEIFGSTILPILEKITIIACPLDEYPNDLHDPFYADDSSDSDLADSPPGKLDLSQCPSLTHVAFGASIRPSVIVNLPTAQITKLELNTQGLICFRHPLLTEVPEVVFPNLLWLHVIDEAGVGAPSGFKTPNLRHLVLSHFVDAEGVFDLVRRSYVANIDTIELRVASPQATLSHEAVSELLQIMGPRLRQLCFSVVGMDSLRKLEWSRFRWYLPLVQNIEIRVKAKVAVDHLLPDSHLPPTFDYTRWLDRGEHLTRSAWWRFVDQNAGFIDMVTALPKLEMLVLDWDRSVYRDRWHSPTLQQMHLRRGAIRLLEKDDAEHSDVSLFCLTARTPRESDDFFQATDNHLSLLQTRNLEETENLN